MKFFPLLVALSCATPHAPQFTAQAAFRYANTIDVGTIDEDTLGPVYTKLQTLAEHDAKNVTLRIDSMGGNIIVGMTWIRSVEDLKKLHPGLHVTCAVDGFAMSMAAVILESSVCDARLATIRSVLLFHNGSVQTQGTVVQIQGTATLLEALNEAMALQIANRLRIPYSVYRARIAASDWIMTTREALVNNAIDELVSPSEIGPPVPA